MCSLFFSRNSDNKDESPKIDSMENEKKTTEFTPEIKCPHCGHLIRERSVYCENCGFRVQMQPKPNKDSETTLELPKINIRQIPK